MPEYAPNQERTNARKMHTTTLHIKNMVCNRCIRVVNEEMQKAGFDVAAVQLGTVELRHNGEDIDRERVGMILQENGFELIEDKKMMIIEAVKTAVITKIHHEDIAEAKLVWPEILSAKTGHDYKYVSQLFSSLEGVTIEQYVILQKTEKVKELIVYNDLSLSEIAFQLGYSSAGHLSNQFKKVTGMSPKDFRGLGLSHRKPLDKVEIV